MNRRLRLPGCWLVVGLVSAAAFVAATQFIDHFPAGEGMEAARELATAQGYQVEPGGLALIVTQPDFWGGCEIEAELQAVADGVTQRLVVKVRRSWTLGRWHVTAIKPRPRAG